MSLIGKRYGKSVPEGARAGDLTMSAGTFRQGLQRFDAEVGTESRSSG